MKPRGLDLSAAMAAKKLGVQELLESSLTAIDTTSSQGVFTGVLKERALQKAEEIQGRINRGEALSPLAGLPVAIQDNIFVAGVEAACASAILKGHTPIFSATAVERLEAAGLIVAATYNMKEFGMGSSPSAPQALPDPAAQAAAIFPLVLGSDTGGEIRRSCGAQGLTGIKPSYGLVSRHGLGAYGSSLDQIGPMGRNIDDTAALLSIISGMDGKDDTCIQEKPLGYRSNQAVTLENLRIGLPRNYIDKLKDQETGSFIFGAARELERAGAKIGECDLPLSEFVIAAHTIITAAEGSTNLSRFDGLKYGPGRAGSETLMDLYRLSRSEGFGYEVKKKILLGSFLLLSENYDRYYRKALKVRSLIIQTYARLFENFDLIMSPVGEVYDIPANLAGLPSAVLPCGSTQRGQHYSFQFIGRAFSEDLIIQAAQVYQNRTKHHWTGPEAASSEEKKG